MELENLIKNSIRFEKMTATGFNMCKCPMCRDYQARLGIVFDNGSIGANCFNCGFKTKYTETDGYVPKKFRKLLSEFNVDDEDIDKCLAVNFINSKKNDEKDLTLAAIKKLNLNTPEISLPDGAVMLRTAPDSATKRNLIKYLEDRKFDIDSYPWHFIPDTHKDEYLKNRVIIPYYRNGKIIYWQARTVNSFVKKRYLNCEAQKTAVVFGYDELYSWSSKPLFIAEGVFDAIALNGVCLLGSALSNEAISILQKTKRRVIFVIDKDTNGKKLAQQVIDAGWEISFVPTGASDINDSIIKNGKLFTVYHLLNNTSNGFIAKTKVNLLCKK